MKLDIIYTYERNKNIKTTQKNKEKLLIFLFFIALFSYSLS